MASRFWKFLVPKNQAFFLLFNQATANNVQMAQLLHQAVNSTSPNDETLNFNNITRLKMKGNDLKHQVYLASAKAFISPFERNDMYALASAINSVCDNIHISSRRVSMYQSTHITASVKELSGLVIESNLALDYSVKSLNNLDNSDKIAESCNKIKRLEHYADLVYGKAVSIIMTHETSSVELIKYTEILSAFEKTTDRCEDATNVIESIIIKNK